MNAKISEHCENTLLPLSTGHKPGDEDDIFLGRLRVIPNGKGPNYWYLEAVGHSLQIQQGWPDDVRVRFIAKMCRAASLGSLTVRDSYDGILEKHPGLFLNPNPMQMVTRTDVNEWLSKTCSGLLWTAHSKEPSPPKGPSGNVTRWTEEFKKVLRAYRDSHTMAETAEHFGVSESRIRQVDPRKDPVHKGHSVFTHRTN